MSNILLKRIIHETLTTKISLTVLLKSWCYSFLYSCYVCTIRIYGWHLSKILSFSRQWMQKDYELDFSKITITIDGPVPEKIRQNVEPFKNYSDKRRCCSDFSDPWIS